MESSLPTFVTCFGFLVVRYVGSKLPDRELTHTSCIGRWSLSHWTTREVSVHVLWAVISISGTVSSLSFIEKLGFISACYFQISLYLVILKNDWFRGTCLSHVDNVRFRLYIFFLISLSTMPNPNFGILAECSVFISFANSFTCL